MTTLDEFLTDYGNHPTTVIDVAQGEPSPFIVIKYGEYAVIVNPIALTDHLSVDVHSFVDGVRATGGVFGMTTGRRVEFADTGTTSHGWASTGLVAVLVGEQGKPCNRADCNGVVADGCDHQGKS
jgi:hypothetical protein